MTGEKGISCETRWTCTKTHQWKDFVLFWSPSLSLSTATPFLTFTIFGPSSHSFQSAGAKLKNVLFHVVRCRVSRCRRQKHPAHTGLNEQTPSSNFNSKEASKGIRTAEPEHFTLAVTNGHNRFSVARVSSRVISFQKRHKNLSVN